MYSCFSKRRCPWHCCGDTWWMRSPPPPQNGNVLMCQMRTLKPVEGCVFPKGRARQSPGMGALHSDYSPRPLQTLCASLMLTEFWKELCVHPTGLLAVVTNCPACLGLRGLRTLCRSSPKKVKKSTSAQFLSEATVRPWGHGFQENRSFSTSNRNRENLERAWFPGWPWLRELQ